MITTSAMVISSWTDTVNTQDFGVRIFSISGTTISEIGA